MKGARQHFHSVKQRYTGSDWKTRQRCVLVQQAAQRDTCPPSADFAHCGSPGKYQLHTTVTMHEFFPFQRKIQKRTLPNLQVLSVYKNKLAAGPTKSGFSKENFDTNGSIRSFLIEVQKTSRVTAHIGKPVQGMPVAPLDWSNT